MWTDERVVLLKQMWGDRCSASQIAAELHVTRNAVIGKVHRLGLSGRSRTKAVPRPPKPQAPALRRVIALLSRVNQDPLPILELEPEPAPIEIIPINQRCTLSELSDEKCRWPFGTPGTAGFFFCGGGPIAGLPYCGYHSRVAYQPSVSRRDRRPVRG